MRKLILTLAVASIFCSMSAKSDNDTIVAFRISPAMHCANCEKKIKSNLRFEKGVTGITANAPDSIVSIKFDSQKTDIEKISKAFKKIGYAAAPTKNNPKNNRK